MIQAMWPWINMYPLSFRKHLEHQRLNSITCSAVMQLSCCLSLRHINEFTNFTVSHLNSLICWQQECYSIRFSNYEVRKEQVRGSKDYPITQSIHNASYWTIRNLTLNFQVSAPYNHNTMIHESQEFMKSTRWMFVLM
jgi:hypothetical protein